VVLAAGQGDSIMRGWLRSVLGLLVPPPDPESQKIKHDVDSSKQRLETAVTNGVDAIQEVTVIREQERLAAAELRTIMEAVTERVNNL
jgi:hypothetical protein